MWAWHDTTWMWLSMIVFWSLIAVVAYYAAKGLSPAARPSGPRATEILKERYARGEISPEEYRERRRTLEREGAGDDER